MNIQEIVKKYLEENGYDGLVNMDNYCGCELSDLMPCGQPDQNCQPGYKVPCPEDCELGGGCDFHISTKKGT